MNINKLRTIAAVSAIVVPILLTGNTYAASTTNKGATPNGKPFTYINQQLEANATAISSLQQQVGAINLQMSSINSEIDSLEAAVATNAEAIAITQANLSTTNQNLDALRTQTEADISSLKDKTNALQSQIDNLHTQINDLTLALTIQLTALQAAIDENSGNIDSLSIQVSTITAQIVVLNNAVVGSESRLTAVETELNSLQVLVAQLDTRLISVEHTSHNHALPASCAEILSGNSSAADGTYEIDPDADGPVEKLSVYCDMTNHGGGWTNLNFSTNQVILDNGNLINCSSLSQTANSITCNAPLFNNGGYMYHYRCDGNDGSANYMLEHIGVILGHNGSVTTGFNSLSQRHTGVHGYSTTSKDEYLYINGEIVHWNDPVARASYSSNGNGSCVPGYFTLTL